MKLSISPNDLLDALAKVIPAVGKVEVTTCVRMNVVGDVLRLCCTDGEVMLSTKIHVDSAEVESVLGVCVNAKTLSDILRKLDKSKMVTIKTLENNRLVITSGRFKNTLQYINDDVFPILQIPTQSVCSATFKTSELFSMIELTKYCVSTDSYRAFLKGVNLSFVKNNVEFVSSNGHMMAFAKTSSGITSDNIADIIMPKKAMDIISVLTKNADEQTACLRVFVQFISLEVDGVEMTSVLINSKYPNVKPIIDFNAEIHIVANVEELVESIKRVAVTSNSVNKAVKLSLKDNELYISSKNSKQEEAEDCISVITNSNSYESAFNSDYLLYVLSKIAEEKVCLLASKNSNNCKIVPYTNDSCAKQTSDLQDNNFIYTISRIVL